MTVTFPTDETTLTLLIAACQINPDSGHTELQSFLHMGASEKSCEQIEWSDPPVFEVEYEEGAAPFSEQQVIETLAREVLALRAALAAADELAEAVEVFVRLDDEVLAMTTTTAEYQAAVKEDHDRASAQLRFKLDAYRKARLSERSAGWREEREP